MAITEFVMGVLYNKRMDTIFIREMRAESWIGIYEWEKLKPQTLDFDLEIGLDTHQAGSSDNIRDTVDYGKVVERIRADLKDQHFKLLEALAEHIANVVLHDFHAEWIRISVAKIAHMRGVKMVGVTILRKRNPRNLPPGFVDAKST